MGEHPEAEQQRGHSQRDDRDLRRTTPDPRRWNIRPLAQGGDGSHDGAGENRLSTQAALALRERAAIFGGGLRWGPRAEGGFAIHASLPTAFDELEAALPVAPEAAPA